MKLLYMYVESLGDIFRDIFFNFSSEYIVEYDKSCNRISIKSNPKYFINFYGKSISDITAIVGKNGSGKSSILETVGREMKERIELLKIEEIEIKDRYFMIFHVEKDMFYFEGVGIIQLENIISRENLPQRNSDIVRSFYFRQNDLGNYTIDENYVREIKDRIIYIRDDLIRSSSNSYIYLNSNHSKFIPRVTGSVFSWVDWYNFYLDLFQKKVIQSPAVHILFKTSEYLRALDGGFFIQAVRKSPDPTIGGIVVVAEEWMDDFFSRMFYLSLNSIIVSANKLLTDEQRDELHSINRKYVRKTSYILNDYLKVFDEYSDVFNKRNHGYSDEFGLLTEYTIRLKKYFRALYQVKNHIITGVDEFKLVISSSEKNVDILDFFHHYTKLRDFIVYHFDYDRIGEDILDDTESNKRYSGKHLEIKIPFQIERIQLSTGEKKILELLSTIVHEIYESTVSQQIRLMNRKIRKNIIVLIDEIESTMHLEWSRNLLNYVTSYLDEMIIPGYTSDIKYIEFGISVQLIMTTHSPFLLSDLNKDSIIALEFVEGKVYKRESIKAFAQNIQRIMNNEFFIKDCYGTFAQNKIEQIIKLCDKKQRLSKDEKKKIKYVIEEIGEPILRKKLEDKFMQKLKDDSDIQDEEVGLLSKIEQLYGGLTQRQIVDKIRKILNDRPDV
ncbi:AAA family ATPase [Paenibacillus sp. NPDC058174]|uniref:AAA family ATPase n=1 Tax=Paenibacillus sp. NPDC058174 TaxID=3346366 RepID=UPI0036DB3F26